MIDISIQEGHDLDQAVRSLTKSSIELAEAASNYGALKVVFGIFVVFVLVMLIMFICTVYNINRRVYKLSEATKNVSDFFDGVVDHTIGVSEAQIMIRRSMNSISIILKYYIMRIRMENHIVNKEATRMKVERIVDNEYAELSGFLSNYFCKNRPLSEFIDIKDTDVIKDFMIEQIYIPNDDFTISSMDQSVTIFINGIKQVYLKNL